MKHLLVIVALALALAACGGIPERRYRVKCPDGLFDGIVYDTGFYWRDEETGNRVDLPKTCVWIRIKDDD